MTARFTAMRRGLMGSCRGVCIYRHAIPNRPGFWYVSMIREEIHDFLGITYRGTAAVVDDFGNLVRVE